MSTANLCPTALGHLPAEVLARCIPWDLCDPFNMSGIKPLMAVNKQMLYSLLTSASPSQLALRLELKQLDDVPSRRATLKLLSKAFPSLCSLRLDTYTSPNMDCLASLLDDPASTEDHALSRITHLCLWRLSTDFCLLLPHLVPASVATAMPNLRQLKLEQATYSAELHQDFLTTTQALQQHVEHVCAEQQARRVQALAVFRAKDHVYYDGTTRVHIDCLLEQCAKVLLQAVQGQAVQGHITAPVQVPQLQCLKLWDCRLWSRAAAFQQQLQALPGLRELSFMNCEFMDPDTEQAYLAAVTQTCSSQLVSFEWANAPWDDPGVDDDSDAGARHMPVLFSKPYPQLQQLHVMMFTVDDAIMELLLQQAPKLKLLEAAGFQLAGDFSSRQYSWETVVMSCRIDIASLRYMPLGSRPKICVDHGRIDVCFASSESSTQFKDPQASVATAAAAVAAVEHCGGFHTVQVPQCPRTPTTPGLVMLGEEVGSYWPSQAMHCLPAHMDKVVIATLPMLGNVVGSLGLCSLRITRDLLAAINRHVPHCHKVEFYKACTFDADVWGDMVSLLRRVTELTVRPIAAMQQLLDLCATATHSIKLILYRKPGDAGAGPGWKEVLQQTQRDAQHCHVHVDCYDWYDSDDDDHGEAGDSSDDDGQSGDDSDDDDESSYDGEDEEGEETSGSWVTVEEGAEQVGDDEEEEGQSEANDQDVQE